MTSQLEKDWEEQQHGLQGTVTGSAHNQIGLDSRMPPIDTDVGSQQRRSKSAPAPTPKMDFRQDTGPTDFNIPTAILGFAAVCYWLYTPTQESNWPMLIGAAIGAALCGRFYKPIWGLVLAIGALYLLGVYDG